jgi:hypothetical protein
MPLRGGRGQATGDEHRQRGVVSRSVQGPAGREDRSVLQIAQHLRGGAHAARPSGGGWDGCQVGEGDSATRSGHIV